MKTNWPTKKLGECLVQFDRGISWSRNDEGGTVAVLRIPNIQEGHINLDDLKYINAKSGNGELDQNDIVMVASNGNPDLVGRSALVTEKEAGMRFASFLARLRLEANKLLPQYAQLFLLTRKFKKILRSKIATTSGIYNLRKNHIEKIDLSLPPLKIQKQIVEWMDKIAEAQKLNDELIQKSDELFQSLLHQELNPASKDWEEKNLGDVAIFKRGPFGGSLKKEIFVSEGYKIYEQKNAIHNDFGIGNYFITKDKYNEMIDFAIKPGDLIISCSGTMGKVAIVPKNVRPGIINQALMRLTALSSIITTEYLKFLMGSSSLQKKLFSNTKGSAIQNVASVKSFKNTKVFIPPMEIQKQIVVKLSAAQEYKKQLLTQKAKLKELFDSVLHKSMNGERRNFEIK